SISTFRRDRCRGHENCDWRDLRSDEGRFVYQYIKEANQIIDLGLLLSAEWHDVDVDDSHCSSCCDCCKSPVHIAEICNCYQEMFAKEMQERVEVRE
ncbi:hypothetical protein PFISCL1PPCAC_16893, partial [Pristionchus fissidentatus]